MGRALTAFADRLRARLDPLALGFTVVAAREEGLAASRGATDFGEYFFYFSYFLVVAALLLTGLFFKLGIEQRLREVGSLTAMGFPSGRVRRLFLAEGVVLSSLGGLLGVAVACAYAWVIVYGLRAWWVDAVGTRLLTLHVSSLSLAAGVLGGVAVASIAIALTLRHLKKVPPRSLLGGEMPREGPEAGRQGARRALVLGGAALIWALVLLGAASAGVISEVAGFFGAGNVLLIALLLFQWVWLRSESRRLVTGQGSAAVSRMGFRNTTHRPGRSLVAIALIAFASFTIVAVDAFRKDDSAVELDRQSGNGGFPLVGESLLALHWDPNTTEGRDAFNLPYPDDPDSVPMEIRTFRLRPGRRRELPQPLSTPEPESARRLVFVHGREEVPFRSFARGEP